MNFRAVRSAVPAVLDVVPDPLRRCHVPPDLDAVTTVAADREEDPTAAGLTAEAIAEIWDAVRRLYRWGMHPAIALCLRRDGHVVLDRAIGHARGNGPHERHPDPEPVTPDTPFVIASASKAVTAMVVHLLDERGALHVDDRVCEYIPEFAAHGKDTITINHVLSHRAGVPNVPREAMDLDRIDDRDWITRVMADTVPVTRPGRFVAYHAVSGGFILGEIVHRVTGKPIREVLETEILGPLGFTGCTYGTAPDQLPRVAVNHPTGLPVLPPLSGFFERALGLPFDEVTQVLNDPRFLTAVVPSASIVSTANELSRFFDLLRAGGTLDGVRVFEPRTVRRAVSEQSYLEIDFTLGFPFRYAMGFMLGAKTFSLYGPDTTHAFGHLGFSNIIGFADPERGTAGALLTSGKPVLGPHLYDLWDVMRTVARVCPRDRLAASPLTVG